MPLCGDTDVPWRRYGWEWLSGPHPPVVQIVVPVRGRRVGTTPAPATPVR